MKGNYLKLILIHIALALATFLVPFLAKIYGFFILVFGLLYVIKNRNRNNEALYAAGYVVGSEVFLRMTGGSVNYEFSKYAVIVFMFLGMVYSGISKKSYPYMFFLILLVPGIVVSTITLNAETDFRKAIMFNLSGPICLGVSALYCYARRITLEEVGDLLLAIGLPIISTTVYLFFYNVNTSIKDVVTGTGSNFATSGGFGPNQVSTILGLGAFLFFTRVVLYSKSKVLLLLNFFIVAFISYRGLITFSRGGMIVAGVMIVLFLTVLAGFVAPQARGKIVKLVFFAAVSFMLVWSYSLVQTNGLIEKRYANKDALGREKKSMLTGREELMETEFKMFMDNPLFGVGVGKNKEFREETTGIQAASHNEITRMLAEHGSLGLLGFVILLTVPFVLYLDNKMHLYMLSFYVFWLLTLNHAAMRTAAPAFIYALTLLKIYALEKPAVHRE